MKRILYIAMANIHSHSGGGFANRAYYESLLMHYHDRVDLLEFAEDVMDEDKNYYGVPAKNSVRKMLDLSKGVIHRFTPWLLSFLENNRETYACCIINSGIIGDIIPEIKKSIPKVVVIHHNDEVAFQMDNNRPTTIFGFTPYFVNRNQRMAYLNADLNLFLTEYDKLFFETKYGRLKNNNRVIGVYETINRKNNLLLKDLPKNHLVITGALHNVQSIKGIKDFCNNYLSSLANFYDGEYKLTIAGRNPGKYIWGLQSRCIDIIANPVDMDAIVNKAGIFLCPINVGSGLKLRIMDGLKLGMPILTHEVSSRGYEFFFEEKWFQVYNDKESFIRGLKSLNDIIANEKNVQQRIFDKYFEYFSFEKGDKRFFSAVEEVLN